MSSGWVCRSGGGRSSCGGGSGGKWWELRRARALVTVGPAGTVVCVGSKTGSEREWECRGDSTRSKDIKYSVDRIIKQ